MGGSEKTIQTDFVDLQPELAIRRATLLETQVLKDKAAVLVGVGTGGAHAAIELAKSGVGRFDLIDPDRLTAGNLVRRPGGTSQVARFTGPVVRNLIHQHNPNA